MILVVLSTHAELASATKQGRSYCETGLFQKQLENETCSFGQIYSGTNLGFQEYRILANLQHQPSFVYLLNLNKENKNVVLPWSAILEKKLDG